MPFKIVRNDITKMQVDAIVNTANEAPIYGPGVDTAIYKAAGEEKLLTARNAIGWLKQGEVAITPGFNLPAKYIIHAISPYYADGNEGEDELLRACYRESLRVAYENGCESMAFPLISTGSFHYPKEEGMRIALDEINTFLMQHEMLVYLVVFDEASTKLGKNLYPELEAYIDQHYVEVMCEREYDDGFLRRIKTRGLSEFIKPRNREMNLPRTMAKCSKPAEENVYEDRKKSSAKNSVDFEEVSSAVDMDELEEVCSTKDIDKEWFLEESESALNERIKHMSDTFQQYLLYMMDMKGLTPKEVYEGAIISKQLFSKIKLNPNYHPDKGTAMRLCVGAKLNLDETKDMLGRAGYALSPCDKRDIIFSFFIEHQVYSMIEIDIALEEHDLPCFIQ